VTRRMYYLFNGHIDAGIGNVFANCSVKQEHVLAYQCNLSPQVVLAQFSDVDAVNSDRALVDVIEAQQQLY